MPSLVSCRYQYALGAIAMFFAIFAMSACQSTESRVAAKEAKTETQVSTSPISVTTATAVAREVPSFIQVTGSLAADESSDVAPQGSGQVIATPADIGAYAKQGTVLARLNDRDARLRLQQAQSSVQEAVAAVRQAEARIGLRPGGNFDASEIPEVRAANANLEQAQSELRLAESNERRYRELVETGDVASSVYDQYRTQRDTAGARVNSARQQLEAAVNTARQSNQAVQSAEAAVESARAQVAISQKALDDTVVRAPYAGYISSRPIAVGEYVTPASVIATLLRTNPLKLELLVPESEAPFVRPGMTVSLEVESYKDRKFSGHVTAVNPAIDPASRSVTIEAQIENSDNALRAGMFVTARISRQSGERAVFVPRSAVLADRNTNSYRVFVLQGDVAKLRVVQLGGEDGEFVQILSGVQPDEIVVTKNLPQLFEGARIEAE